MSSVLIALLVGMAAFVGGTTPAIAAPAATDPIDVTVAPGQNLAPGTYKVAVRSGGKPVVLTIVVPPPAGPVDGGGSAASPLPPPQQSAPATTAASTPPDGEGGTGPGLGTLILVFLVLLALSVGGAMLYLRVLAPRRYVRPYRQAVAQIEVKRYDLALPALTKLEATLPEQVRSEARFFIAFALYRLDDLQAAEYRLAELQRENAGNADVAYFLAYLRTERRDFDGAESVLEGLDPTLLRTDRKLRKLYGLVKASRAFAAFRDDRIDAAAELFEEVERLGDFASHIPIDLRNRNIIVGTKALFDRDVAAAREQFEALQRAARQTTEPQRSAMLASAELGLALCAWLKKDKDAAMQTEQLLVRALQLLDPEGALAAAWPDGASQGQTDRVAEMMIQTDRPPEEIDQARTIRDIHFLRGMTVLRSWAEAEQRIAAGNARDFLEAALKCFARARDLDPEFSDVHVVVGLLRYYLATDDAERRAGVAVLREAQHMGTRDPEVLQILNRDVQVREANHNAAEKFLELLDRYMQDATVRREVREWLLTRMAQHSKIRDWDTRPELVRRRVIAPTIAEMHSRSELLRARVTDLLQNQSGSADLSDAHALATTLEQQNQAMAESARAIEEEEAKLLALLGDRLLSEVEG